MNLNQIQAKLTMKQQNKKTNRKPNTKQTPTPPIPPPHQMYKTRIPKLLPNQNYEQRKFKRITFAIFPLRFTDHFKNC